MPTKKNLTWKVDPSTGCWVVTSHARGGPGYIQLWFDGKPTTAHRWMYEQTHGPIPKGLYVLHSCDNQECVNPDHLRVGTLVENTRDMVEKGRHARGEKNGHAKLTELQVVFIRAHTEIGNAKMGELVGVTQSVISEIRSRKLWKHVQ